MRADKYLGEFETDDLIYDSTYPIDTKGVRLRKGQGTLKRGTVLAISRGTAGTGEAVMLGCEAAENETFEIEGILTDAVDTGTGEGASSMFTTAYQSGKFNRNRLIVSEGYTISPEDERVMRECGIFLATKMPV